MSRKCVNRLGYSYDLACTANLLTFFTGIIIVCEAMTFRQKSLMDIDIDACDMPPLKRYNSAPFINSTVGETNTSSDTMTQTIDTLAR